MMPTKTAVRALHDARARQAGQDALLPRPAAAPPPLARTCFVEAPGIRGQVMLVFTLPVVPVRLQGDQGRVRARRRTPTARRVEAKFAMVKHVDRVGRMADTLEFADLALPRERFSPELLDAARARWRRRSIEVDGDSLIDPPLLRRAAHDPARHLPRPRPTPTSSSRAVVEYGNAIRELAIANIFPGDMLWRNFGVTRHGRVVFYDYDEIEYLTDCSFRRIPRGPEPGGGARRRAVVRRRAERRLPRGVRDVPARRPAAREPLPPPPRRSARAGVLAGVPAPRSGPARWSTSSRTRSRCASATHRQMRRHRGDPGDEKDEAARRAPPAPGAFLSSAASDFVNGQILYVDGGLLAVV